MLFLFPAVSLAIIDLFTLLLFTWSISSAPDLLHSHIILSATIAVLTIGFALSALFWRMYADQLKKHQNALIRWGKEFAYFPTTLPVAIFLATQWVVGSLFGAWFTLHSTTPATRFYPILFWTFFTSLVITLWLLRLFVPRLKLLAQVKKPSGQVFVGWLVGIGLAVYGGEQLRQNVSIFTDQNFILKYQVWINRSTAIIFPLMMIDLLVIFASLFAFLQQDFEHSVKVAALRLKVNRHLGELEAWMQSHVKIVLQPAFLALIITSIFFAVFLLRFKVTYGSSVDDLTIISLLSGYGGNAPTAFTYVINYLLAFPIMLLYRLPTSINWLMVFFAGTIFLSTWALLYSFLRSKSFRKADLFVAIIFILAFISYLLMHITCTTAAGMAIVTGLFLLLFSGMSDEKAKPAMLIPGGLLVILGSLIRIEAVVLPLVVFLPVWVLHIHRLLRNRACLAALGAAAVFVLAGVIINDAIYVSNPAWNDFRTYSNARSQIQDTPLLSNILLSSDPAKLDPIHWSKNDVEMLKIWFFPDQNIYSLENFQFLISEFPNTQQSILITWNSFIAFMKSTYIFPYLLLMLSTFLLLISAQPKKMHIVSISISSLGVMGIFLYMEWSMKLVDRVILPAMIAISLVNLLFWCLDHQSSHQLEIPQVSKDVPSIMKFITAVLIISSIVVIYVQDFSLSSLNTTRDNIYLKTISDINVLMRKGDVPQNALFLGIGIPIEWSNPFLLNLPSFHYIFMDWITNSPVFEETMKKNEIQSLINALYQRNNVFMFANSEQIPAIEQYILQHNNVQVTEKIIYTYTDPTGVYGTEYLCQFIEK